VWHGGSATISGRSESKRARLALRGAKAESVTWKEEGMEVWWPRFAWSRTPAGPAMAGGGGKIRPNQLYLGENRGTNGCKGEGGSRRSGVRTLLSEGGAPTAYSTDGWRRGCAAARRIPLRILEIGKEQVKWVRGAFGQARGEVKGGWSKR
jgi:hypothetical protein